MSTVITPDDVQQLRDQAIATDRRLSVTTDQGDTFTGIPLVGETDHLTGISEMLFLTDVRKGEDTTPQPGSVAFSVRHDLTAASLA